MGKIPSLLGPADPLRFVSLLPSVQTGSEIDAGIHIQGCDHGHNMVSLGGAPVYGATHLLGLFSVFNPAHFSRMTYATVALQDGRLGGSMLITPYQDIPQAVKGDFSLGIMSASGSLRAPAGKNSAVGVSARRSFLGLLYKPYLYIDDDPFRYDFDDFNLSWLWKPTSADTFSTELYFGSDKGVYTPYDASISVDSGWYNAVAVVNHTHSFGASLFRQRAYFTSYGCDAWVAKAASDKADLSSGISTLGYRGEFVKNQLFAGAEIQLHIASPQRADRQNALEGNLFAGSSYRADFNWSFSAFLKGGVYVNPQREAVLSLSPLLSARCDLFSRGSFELKSGLATQNMFQTGVTSLGFPVEFWMLSDATRRPQKSLFATLRYDREFLSGSYALSAEVYVRRLYNQVEYSGTVLDVLFSSRTAGDLLTMGDGRNYGLNLMLHKQAGALTGWISYALARSLRRQGTSGPFFPSNYERLHEVDIVATYSAARWDAGCTLIAASGLPYTAPDALYISGGQIICRYGPQNGARLAPYARLDVSFNWYFTRRQGREHGLNLSLYNAFGRSNEISYKFVYTKDTFAYLPVSFSLRFMPGIGWFYRF